jgi:hypothetical protein
MPDFKDIRTKLQNARNENEKISLDLFKTKEKLKTITDEKARLERIFDESNEKHITRLQQLKNIHNDAMAAAKILADDLLIKKKAELDLLAEFFLFTDPETEVTQLNDNIPFLLLPLRIETRFKKIPVSETEIQNQLWVRVYPDDCAVDTFEPILSKNELKAAETYWIEMWKAGGIEVQERGAWKVLVGSHGSGRAAWIVQRQEDFKPKNLADKPKKDDENDIILVIATEDPLTDTGEIDAANKYWKAFWLADGSKEGEQAALDAFKEDIADEKRAEEIIEKYRPVNLDDNPAHPLTRSDVAVDVSTLAFSNPDEVGIKQLSWAQAAKVNLMPDRFVLMGYTNGDSDGYEEVIKEIGKLIPSPLIVGPDPLQVEGRFLFKMDTSAGLIDDLDSAIIPESLRQEFQNNSISLTESASAAVELTGQMWKITDKKQLFNAKVEEEKLSIYEPGFRQKDDELYVDPAIEWMVDFDLAVKSGMGFKIDLTQEQVERGFDRLLVLGLRLSSDEDESKALLETMLHNHQYSGTGFSILPQGTPTNNTEKKSASFNYFDDADESFDSLFNNEGTDNDPDDWVSKRDGRCLAESLGIDKDALKSVRNYYGTDQCEAKAMNIALWPATLGYFMETMMAPEFDEDTIDKTKLFFNHFVRGRNAIPAIQIGSQPYGILPTTAFSKMNWRPERDSGEFITPSSYIVKPDSFLYSLYTLISKVSDYWKENFLKDVSYVGKYGDSHQILLDILGLHSGSVEFHQRYLESFLLLYNRLNLEGFLHSIVTDTLDKARLQTSEKIKELQEDLELQLQTIPKILKLFFFFIAYLLQGPVVDDRPLSETKPIRNYTPKPDGKNYIEWLIDAAKTSLDTIRKQDGFIDDNPPTALLYLMLRHAMHLGYWDASLRMHKDADILTGEALKEARKEPEFIHIKEESEAAMSESKWQYLYKQEPQITQNDNLLVAEHITKRLGKEPATQHLNDQILVLEHLKNVPTARLERAFVEHVDCCTYRLDAWRSALINFQLSRMRGQADDSKLESKVQPAPTGIYLGAYGWLEDVRSEDKNLTAHELEPELDDIFNKPGEEPLLKSDANKGYVHAPSLNHAVTAAILRNGYSANATGENPDTFCVNLSSERVRLALSILEGIRNGQSLAALLGYQFERGLHDKYNVVEVDKFIFSLRKEFPLYADRFNTTKSPKDVPIQAIEARNVINGLDLIDHVKKTGNKGYPFGKEDDLPAADGGQADAITAEVNRIMDINDAVADLAMAESVHQIVQGNYGRTAATLDAYSKANFPPIPDVVQTPRGGITLTHRVALHLETGLAIDASSYGNDIPMTPRAKAEPAINKWLFGILPDPGEVACYVTYFDFEANKQIGREVTQKDLQLQPIDLLYILNPESQQAMTELDDRLVNYVLNESDMNTRADSTISIEYMTRIKGLDGIDDKISFFELAPLLKSLRALILRSRPLRASDIMLPNEADSDSEKAVTIKYQRIESALSDLLGIDMGSFKSALDTLLAGLESIKSQLKSTPDDPAALLSELETKEHQIISDIDTHIDDFLRILSDLSLYGIPQTGSGFAVEWKKQLFGALIRKVNDLVSRWDDKIDEYNVLIAQYNDLPPDTTDEEKYSLLKKAERLISTIPTIQLPTDPDDFLNIGLLNKREMFEGKLEVFNTLLEACPATISELLERISEIISEAPSVSDFDRIGIDLSDEKKKIILFTKDILSHAESLVSDIDKRKKDTEDKQRTLWVKNSLSSLNSV